MVHYINSPFPEHDKDCELGDNWKDCPGCQFLNMLWEQTRLKPPVKMEVRDLPSRKKSNEMR